MKLAFQTLKIEMLFLAVCLLTAHCSAQSRYSSFQFCVQNELSTPIILGVRSPVGSSLRLRGTDALNGTQAPGQQSCDTLSLQQLPTALVLTISPVTANMAAGQPGFMGGNSIVPYRSPVEVTVSLNLNTPEDTTSFFDDGFLSVAGGPVQTESTLGVNVAVSVDTSLGNTWMGSILKKQPTIALSNLTLPGSHDSGESVATGCPATPSFAVVTQGLNIAGQLAAGTRFFDIRPYETAPGQFSTGHFGSAGGCLGEPLDNVLNAVKTFLAQNPTEAVILSISHTQDDYDSPASVTDPVSDVYNHLMQFPGLPLFSTQSSNVSQFPLSMMQGKVLLFFDGPYQSLLQAGIDQQYNANPAIGATYSSFSQFNCDATAGCPSGYKADQIYVYDNYTGSPNPTSVLTDQQQKLQKFALMGQDNLFLLSWTATAGVDCSSPLPAGLPPQAVMAYLLSQGVGIDIFNLAQRLNPLIQPMIAGLYASYYDPPNVAGNVAINELPNIFYYDFVTPALNQSIIAANF